MRRVLLVAAAGALLLACAAPAQFAVAAAEHEDAATHPSASFPTLGGFKLPYTDPNQAGLLTLCNEKDQPITHGSLSAVPFVWRAVSGMPTPSAYRVKGVTATLFAYQPRPYTPAGAWSGEALTASSLYKNLAHPMVQETPIDQPLTQMTNSFPPIWDHLIELRVYLGAPGSQPDVRQYAAADLVIKGSTWRMVEGGTSGCTSGTAVSRETLVGLSGASGTPAPGPAAGSQSSAAPASPAGSSSRPAAAAGATDLSAASNDSSSAGGLAPAAIGIGAAVVVVLAATALWRGRRRRRAGP
jgi:hypothetical protein